MLGGILEWIFRYIFGADFELDFSPLFGLRRVREMPVSRDFLRLNSGFWPVFRPIFHRTFHRDFCHRGVRVSGRGLLKLRRVRVSSQGGMCTGWWFYGLTRCGLLLRGPVKCCFI